MKNSLVPVGSSKNIISHH